MATGDSGQRVSEVTGGGSTTAKHRAAGKTVGARAPLIRALRSWPSEAASTIPDPPPQLKGRKAGGVRNDLFRR
jgi:hypothetical protein